MTELITPQAASRPSFPPVLEYGLFPWSSGVGHCECLSVGQVVICSFFGLFCPELFNTAFTYHVSRGWSSRCPRPLQGQPPCFQELV